MKRASGLSLTAGLVLAGVFLFQLSTSASDKASTSVTFTKDVASILHKNCASCHRAGEIAPMSLLSFKDVRPCRTGGSSILKHFEGTTEFFLVGDTLPE